MSLVAPDCSVKEQIGVVAAKRNIGQTQFFSVSLTRYSEFDQGAVQVMIAAELPAGVQNEFHSFLIG